MSRNRSRAGVRIGRMMAEDRGAFSSSPADPSGGPATVRTAQAGALDKGAEPNLVKVRGILGGEWRRLA